MMENVTRGESDEDLTVSEIREMVSMGARKTD